MQLQEMIMQKAAITLNKFAYLHQYREDQDSHQDEEQQDQILQVQCQGGHPESKISYIFLLFGVFVKREIKVCKD